MLVGFWWTSQFTTPWIGPKHGSIMFNQYLLNEGFATTSSKFRFILGIWMHLAISPSIRSLPDPEFPHLDIPILATSGHRASLATSKRCFNKGGAAYFLARDQYVQKISKSKTRQDKWRSIQRRNQRSLDPWGKPVKPRAKCSLLSSCSQQIGSSSKQHLIRKYNEYNFHTWCALSIVEETIPKERSGWECQDTLNEIHSRSQAA